MPAKKKGEAKQKEFKPMKRVITRYYYESEIPYYFYITMPKRKHGVRTIIRNGKMTIASTNNTIKNPNALKRFEVALKISKYKDITFDGELVGSIMSKKDVMQTITQGSKKRVDRIRFYCQDAVKSDNYQEPYKERLQHIPEALPAFQKENTIAIPPNAKEWVFEVAKAYEEGNELEREDVEGYSEVSGLLFRPDCKPYKKHGLKPSDQHFFFKKT